MKRNNNSPSGFATRCLGALCILFMLGLAAVQGAESPNGEGVDFFEAKIRPVLVERCYKCHSEKAEKLKGGLRLDTKEGFQKGGESGPIFFAAEPGKSRLLVALRYQDVDLQMPPKGKLPEAQIADFGKWIELGAPWPEEGQSKTVETKGKFDLKKRQSEHWVWQPVVRPSEPAVVDKLWPSCAIDRFILARLEEATLSPASQADKRTLIRRLSFDLTGLPPTWDETRLFLEDGSTNAYPRQVDRLLNSLHFGEKWGRHWLDLARYAESYGHEFDYQIQNAWRYRDYVIRAFNSNLPYDQFTREQIAGDLLANPRYGSDGLNESRIGAGFFWLGQQVHSPVDVRNYQLDRIDNQIDTLSKTFQGLTVACARCHDHKFDAISTKDYYSLFSVMASSRYAQRSLLHPEANDTTIKELISLKAEIGEVLTAVLTPQVSELEKYVSAVREAYSEKNPSAEARGDIVFEDFEKGSYEGWKVIGNAFGDKPQTGQTIASYQGDVRPLGKYFVNSHNIMGGENMEKGDMATGRITSRAFPISRNYIHALVDGGNHEGKTCVNLLVEGKVVRTMTGANENRMRPRKWDVRELRGKMAMIEVVDEETSGWGNVGIDEIVFSDRPQIFSPENELAPGRRETGEVAREFGLNETKLAKWVEAWDTAPLLLKSNVMAKTSSGETRNKAEENSGSAGIAPIEDWFKDGEAFDPNREGDGAIKGFLIAQTNAPFIRLIGEPGVSSARVSRRLEGAIRSPSFRIAKSYIHVRASGREARLNVVVDGFTLIRAPIYGDLKKIVNSENPAWFTIDVGMWRGHECHLELIDETSVDPSDGVANYSSEAWYALHRVTISDSKTPPAIGVEEGFLAPFDLKGVLEKTIGSLAGGDEEGGGGTEGTTLLNWLIQKQLIEVKSRRLSGLVARFVEVEGKLKAAVYAPSMVDGDGIDDHIFIRGNHKTLGVLAPRGFLEGLHSDNGAYRKGSGRLRLAEEILSADNPLTARVRVNWIWRHLFGQGLVASVDNFGFLGEKPSHPELLDWLAVEFRENGWDMKKMIREMVLSRSYQMASVSMNHEADEIDPSNRLLHKARTRRLESEDIRDSILAASGTLKPDLFGPSVPIYLTEFMDGRGRPGRSGPIDGEGRRSIYVEVRRNFLSPMMLAFDAPIPFTTVGRRTVSNVPAQALILLNDPFVLGEAKRWAEKLMLRGEDSFEERVERIYEQAFARPPSAVEIKEARDFLREQRELYGSQTPELMKDERVWADFCHVVYNLKEFIYIH